jgi:hypothetical protein
LEQIGGTVTVQSELGKGSSFRIVLPRNYGKQRSRKHWLMGLIKSRPAQLQGATAALAHAEAEEQKTINTRRAVG